MVTSDQQEGRFRVLLTGIGNNTEAERDSFCHNISKNYNVPFSHLRKIIERCPIILKKDLSLRRAESLAKTFNSFGASVSIQESIQDTPIFLEFQELAPSRLALESSSLRKSESGTWSVTGRVRNISDETLNDTWVLIQLFEDFEEFIAFEEAPLPINPLPSGQTCPFKVVLEGTLSIKRVSVGFKNASGEPIPAMDKRKKKEIATVLEDKTKEIDLAGSLEKMVVARENESQEEIPPSSEKEVGPTFQQETKEERRDAQPVSDELEEEVESALVKSEVAPDVDEGAVKSRLDASVFQEATQLLKDISEVPKEAQAEEREVPSLSWIGLFRDAVEAFYQARYDVFSIWFEECRAKGEFENSLHRLLTILVHSRFDQGTQPIKALENTQRLFRLVLQPNLLLDEVPTLEGTSFFPGEVWRDLFYLALRKIHQTANTVLGKNKWNVFDLERSIRVIPQIGNQNSRMAIQWISELIPDVVKIDFSVAPIAVGEAFYRVAARLGIVDPRVDSYQGGNLNGNTRIQSFAMTTFPLNPLKAEKPMSWMGDREERGGHCFPIQPWCNGCLFETFCPRLYLDFNPSKEGMRD